jgi:hypothetical protein
MEENGIVSQFRGRQEGLPERLRPLDTFLRGGPGTPIAQGFEGLSGNAACTFEHGGLPGIVMKYRFAMLRIGQVRIALEQRFHNINYTGSGWKKKDLTGLWFLDLVAPWKQTVES